MLVADSRLLVELLVQVPSTYVPSALARDYERGTTIAVVAGCGAATVAGCGAIAVVGCGAVGPLGVVLGVVAAVVDRGVRYAGVPSAIGSPPSSGVGCPAPK